MRTELKLTVAAIAAIIVAGCATQPTPDNETRQVPRERVFNTQLLADDASAGVVTVKRDSGFMGGGATLELFVDAKPAAELRRAELVVLHLPPGPHILSVAGGGNTAETQAIVSSGTLLHYRIGISAMGDRSIQPTAF